MAILTFGQRMGLIYNLINTYFIRLSSSLSLIFFVITTLAGCKGEKKKDISINWNNNQAVGVTVSLSLLDDVPEDSVVNLFTLQRINSGGVSILGDKKIVGDKLVFTPLIPLSPGMSYEIRLREKKVGRLEIPLSSQDDPPKVLRIYPTSDSLPENLLKFYIEFSHPMREGNSLRHISLLDGENDTVPNVFLELQPELWNNERTVLTIWLDPGRIKRDLIPNQQMGNPLQTGKKYTLSVSPDWSDARGRRLNRSTSKQFTVLGRDTISPSLDRWELVAPSSGTLLPLKVTMGESLDYFLVQETIHITDARGKSFPGSIKFSDREPVIHFTPSQTWVAGGYTLRVASKLEDLAGNNLNKMFDRDISINVSAPDKRFYEKSFRIK